MDILICTIIIMLPNGYRQVEQVKGVVVAERGDYYMMDFEDEFTKRGVDLDLQTQVQTINGNSCLKPSTEIKLATGRHNGTHN
jgi:hypothetical protein